MGNPLENKTHDLASICRPFHVERLELFGSATSDAFMPEKSDLDFLVTFQPMEPKSRKRAFFGLLGALRKLTGYPVDLVESEQLENPFVRANIDQSREALYAASE